MKTIVLGASTNPERYAHKAALRLLAHAHEVLLIGKQAGEIQGVPILTDFVADGNADIHTVTLYLSPSNQQAWYEDILAWKPKRIIFNPNTENEELATLAAAQGIEVIEACTLVMLATGQYD